MLGARTKSGKRRHHRREHDKKICALGLLALLSAPAAALPPECQAAYGQMASALVSLLSDLKTQIAERKEMEANDDGRGGWPAGWSDDDEFDEELGEDQDEGDEPVGLDEAALAKLAAKARAVNPFGGHNRYGNHDSDDSDDDGMLTDDENVTSPLDAVDPFVSFAEMMSLTASADAAKFAALNAGMDQQTAQALMMHADVRRKEIVEEKQEEERKKAERAAKLGAGAV
jgi:hypothetical protein